MLPHRSVLRAGRAKIDADILALKERIRSLKSSRNSLSPINFLPPEILTEIFSWLQWLCGRSLVDTVYFSDYGFLKWMTVTRVCQRWRQTALSCPRLWTVIPAACRPGYTCMALERSGLAPLFIYAAGGLKDEFFQTAFSQQWLRCSL